MNLYREGEMSCLLSRGETFGKGVPVLNLAPRHKGVWVFGGLATRILILITRWR